MERIFRVPIARFSNICGRFVRCNAIFFSLCCCCYFSKCFHKSCMFMLLILFFFPLFSFVFFLSYKIQFIVRSIGKEIDCSIHNVSMLCCCYSCFPIMLCHAHVICLTLVRIVFFAE